MVIRDYRSDDLSAYVRVNNEYYADMPTTEEQRVHEQNARTEDLRAKEWVGEVDGKPVIFGIYLKAYWLRETGRGFVHHVIDPRFSGHPIEREMLEVQCVHARDMGDERVTTSIADKHTHHLAAVLAAGFAIDQRQPVTAVDLVDFRPELFQPTIDRLRKEGLEFISLAELDARGGDWRRDFHEMHGEVLCDVPMQEVPKPIPWDRFEKMLGDPKRYDLASKFIALDGGRMIGVSELQPNAADPSLGQTMLTGVVQSHRRRGIATALKATAMKWAMDHGMRRIATDNEENNPMLELNQKLGFRHCYTLLVCSKPA